MTALMRIGAPTAESQVRRIKAQFPVYAKGLFQPHRYKVLFGGRGGARSWSVARALLLKSAAERKRVLCTREIQSSLKDSVHRLLQDQIDLLEIPGFKVNDRAIRHRNGSLFLFEGLRHNVQKIKSLEGIDICWVEEAERVVNNSWRVLIPTIRKSGSEIWVTFNPDQEEDATYQRFVVRPPKDTFALQVNWEDNPWFPEDLRADMEYDYSVDTESADHVWGGELRKVSDAQILRGKWRVEEFTVPYHMDGEQRVYLWNGPYQGMDFGFGSDPFAAIRCWVHDQVLYIEHEVFKPKLEIDDAATECVTAIDGFASYTTRADSARPDSISYLRRHGLPRIVGAVKGPHSVEDGIAHLRSYRGIVVHPRCKHTISECKRYSYRVDERSGDVLPIVIDAHNHCIDSLRYAVEPMIKPIHRTGFIFVDETQKRLCPECDSYLPDDGICPQCGWESDAPDVHAIPVAPVATLHGIATGNGNGNGKKKPRISLGGLND